MISRIGNWQNIGRMVNEMAKDIENIQMEELRQLGLKAEKSAVMHMRNQDLGWKPLKTRKIKKGRSEKILIDTSSYLQSITSWSAKRVVLVGVKREAKHKESRLAIANIASIHEYGSKSRNIPARPLWQPVLKEIKEEVAKRKGFVPSVVEYFKRKL